MFRFRWIYLLLIVPFLSTVLRAQEANNSEQLRAEGLAFFEQGDYDMAHNYFNSARLIFLQNKDWQSCVDLAINRSKLQETRGDLGAALGEIAQAFGDIEEDNPVLAPLYIRTAEIHFLKADSLRSAYAYDRALECFQDSIKSLLPSFDPMDNYINPHLADYEIETKKASLLKLIIQKAHCLKSIGENQEHDKALYTSLNAYKQADDLFNEIRSELNDAELLQALNEPIFDFYLDAAESANLIFEQTEISKHQEKSIYFSQKSKAIQLLALDLETGDSSKIKQQKSNLELLDNPAQMELNINQNGFWGLPFLVFIPLFLIFFYFKVLSQ